MGITLQLIYQLKKLYRVHVMDLSYALYALVLSVFLPF